MDPNVFSAIRLLHFLGMAVWFASALSIGGDVRKTIARGKPHTDVLADRVDRQINIGLIASLVTIGSGLGLIFALGGFASVGPRIHAGFSLALVTVAVEVLGLRPTVGRLRAALGAGDGRDLRALTGRVAMFAGITHSLKLVTLVLMVFRIGGK